MEAREEGHPLLDLAFVGLLTQGIRLVRDVIGVYADRRYSLASQRELTEFSTGRAGGVVERQADEHQVIERHVIERQQIVRETTVVTERVLDKEFVERVIQDAVSSLDKLIELNSTAIIDEMHRIRARDAVQEVKARASSLRILLNATELDIVLVTQMLTGALNPLQVSLEKARYVLHDYGNKESWDYCYLVGSSALLAGYAYLGQRMQYLEDELMEHSKRVQYSILDSIAVARVASGVSIPWSDVPKLIEPEGAEALLGLYEATMAESEGAKELTKSAVALPFDVTKQTVEGIRLRVSKVNDPRVVERMIDAERTGSNRVSALDALRRRHKQLVSA
jgi:hypothetical protein